MSPVSARLNPQVGFCSVYSRQGGLVRFNVDSHSAKSCLCDLGLCQVVYIVSLFISAFWIKYATLMSIACSYKNAMKNSSPSLVLLQPGKV